MGPAREHAARGRPRATPPAARRTPRSRADGRRSRTPPEPTFERVHEHDAARSTRTPAITRSTEFPEPRAGGRTGVLVARRAGGSRRRDPTRRPILPAEASASRACGVSEPPRGEAEEFELPHRQDPADRRAGRDRVRRRPQGVRAQPGAARAEHGAAREQDLDDPRPFGNGQVGLHQAHRRAALSRPGRRDRARALDPEPARRRPVRAAQEVRRAVPGRRAVRVAEPVRQRRVPAAPAHREGRRGDRGDRQPAPQRGRARQREREDAQRALRAGCASAPASPARS